MPEEIPLFKLAETKIKSVNIPISLLNTLSRITVDPEKQKVLGKDDFFKCIRPLLCFGRILGVVPLSNLFEGKLSSVSFRNNSAASLTSLVFSFGVFLTFLSAFAPFIEESPREAGEVARKFGGIVFHGIGLFVYIHIFKNSFKLMDCFWMWRNVKTRFFKEDTNLRKYVLLFPGIIFVSGLLEHITYQRKFYQIALLNHSSGNFSSAWEYYYLHRAEKPVTLIPYNIPTAVFLFVAETMTLLAWVYGDVLVFLLARAMYKRFDLHVQDFEEAVSMNQEG